MDSIKTRLESLTVILSVHIFQIYYFQFYIPQWSNATADQLQHQAQKLLFIYITL